VSGPARTGVRLAALVALALGVGCGRAPEEALPGEPYLLVWAGDADRRHSDFLALIDAEPTSASYGKVVRTYPVGSRGNEPQHLNDRLRDDRRVFAGGVLSNRTFVFDFRRPLKARLLHVDEARGARGLWAPHAYVTLPRGGVVVACSEPAGYRGEPRELVRGAGGLIELRADGRPVREISAADRNARGLIIAPHGASAAPALDRLVTTNAGRGYTATTVGKLLPGITVQVWRLRDLVLLGTVVLPAGPRGEENLGPLTARFLGRLPMVYVSTNEGAALYASDSVDAPHPVFRLVHDFGAGARAGGTAVTPDDRFYVAALTGVDRLVALDLADPWHPRPVSAVRFDRDPTSPRSGRAGGPHAVTMSADGTRVAVSDYTIDVPAHSEDGDRRVHVVRLDPRTGALRIDTAFRDEVTGGVGVDFNRRQWPHGATGPARPAGLLFVAPAPPEPEEG
jgi:hypothetical protein